eukprot:m.1641794 g.1641794  ORF g.1641794 m.1641794 type:complete len:88 (+) comp49766_c0_seq1:2-265(+)
MLRRLITWIPEPSIALDTGKLPLIHTHTTHAYAVQTTHAHMHPPTHPHVHAHTRVIVAKGAHKSGLKSNFNQCSQVHVRFNMGTRTG